MSDNLLPAQFVKLVRKVQASEPGFQELEASLTKLYWSAVPEKPSKRHCIFDLWATSRFKPKLKLLTLKQFFKAYAKAEGIDEDEITWAEHWQYFVGGDAPIVSKDGRIICRKHLKELLK